MNRIQIDYICDNYCNRTAFINQDETEVTYSELKINMEEMYKYFGVKGLIICFCSNCMESVCGYLTCLNYGIPVMLEHSDNIISNIRLHIENYMPQYIWMPDNSDAIQILRANNIAFEIIYSKGRYILLRLSYDEEPCAINEHLGVLISTSGTSGAGKFVRLNYENIYDNAYRIIEYLRIKSGDVAVTTLPMSYSYGLSVINTHIFSGATVVLNNYSVTDRRFWELIKDCKVSNLAGVPYTYEIMKRMGIFNMQLPHLQYMTQAGGHLSVDLQKEYANYAANTGKRFVIMYGQTEATARMAYLPYEEINARIGSVGKVIPGGVIILKDEDGNIITGSNRQGEIVYSGKNVAMGYTTGRADLIKGDEWNGVLHTGDIGRYDEDGFLYIVGRKSGFLKLCGKRINLIELEKLIREEFNYKFQCICSGNDRCLKITITDMQYKDEIKSYVRKLLNIPVNNIYVDVSEKLVLNKNGKIMRNC